MRKFLTLIIFFNLLIINISFAKEVEYLLFKSSNYEKPKNFDLFDFLGREAKFGLIPFDFFDFSTFSLSELSQRFRSLANSSEPANKYFHHYFTHYRGRVIFTLTLSYPL